MSAYIEFYQRIGDRFIPFASFSRSSRIYGLFNNFAPWEKIRALDENKLDCFYSLLADSRHDYECALINCERTMEFVKDSNSPIEEKMRVRGDLERDIEDLRDDLEEIAAARTFLNLLGQMIDQCEWMQSNDVRPDRYIYCGIEIGNPSVEDILDEKI